jgi:hypothetical protein
VQWSWWEKWKSRVLSALDFGTRGKRVPESLVFRAWEIPEPATHRNAVLHQGVVLLDLGTPRVLVEALLCQLVLDVTARGLERNSWLLRGKAAGIFHPFCRPGRVTPSNLVHTVS